MLPPFGFEPDILHQQLQDQLDQLDEQERRQRELVRQQQEQQSGLISGLGNAFEMLTRPGRAVRTGITEAMLGGNPLQGFALGLQGGGPSSFAQVLESQGVGTAPVGPFDTRGIAGFGLDVATDPLSYLPLGRIASGIRGGAELAAGPGGRAATTAGMEIGPGLAQDVFSRAFAPTPTTEAMKAVASSGFPVLGGGVSWLLDRISPAILAEHPRELAYQAGRSNIDNLVTARMAPLLNHGLTAELNDAGQVLTPGLPPVAWNDLAQNLSRAQTSGLAQHDIEFFQKIHDEAQSLWQAFKDERAKLPGPLQKNFAADEASLDPGQIFIPRFLYQPDTGAVAVVHTGKIGGQLGFQYERVYPTVQEALQDGFRSADPITTMVIRERQVLEKINQMQYAQLLIPQRIRGGAEVANVQFLDTLKFPADEAQRISQFVTRTADPTLTLLADINAVPRAFQTGVDVGSGFIQGLPTLATDPVRWLTGQKMALQALLDPAVRRQYLAAPASQEALSKVPNLGMGAGGMEFFGMAGGGAGAPTRPLPSFLARLGPPGEAASFLLGHAQEAFDMLGDYIRIESAKSWLPHLDAHPEDAYKIGDFINHMTGSVNRMAQGVSPTQIAAERAVLFAPSYTAASFALMGDLLRGGPVAREALNALGSMAVVGLVGYERLAQVLGQTPIYDPKDARFMTVQAGGQRVGIGSVWTSLVHTLGKISADAVQDPGKLASLDPQNPFVRFWLGRASPGVGLASELLQGETYIGQPLKSPGDIAGSLPGRVLPFTISSPVEAAGSVPGGLPAAGASLAANIAGLRSFPTTVQDVRNDVAQEKFGKPYTDLLPVQQAQVQNDERVKAKPLPQGARYEGERQRAAATETYRTAIQAAAGQVQAGELTANQFRQRVDEASSERQLRFGGIPDIPSTRKPTAAQQEIEGFYTILRTGRDVYGRTTEAHEKAETYAAGMSPAGQELLRQTRLAAAEHLSEPARSLILALDAARDELRPYREIRKSVMQDFGVWDAWLTANPAQQDRLTYEPAYILAKRFWDQQQEMYRRTHPEADADLVRWYGLAPIMQQGMSRMARGALGG